jgi:hypothetical protein
MNSPLIIFIDILPREIISIIQLYLTNDFAVNALKEYYSYLYYKKELYEDFVYQQYVAPNCSCRRYYNQRAERWKTRECSECFKYDSTIVYMPCDFKLCIWDNPQFRRIQYGEKPDYDNSE